VSEHHDAEEPAKGGEAHQQSDENGPPKNAAGVFLLGKAPATVRTVLIAVAQKSDLHDSFAKILVFINQECSNSTISTEFEKEIL
jgi:hypothetical protein